MSYMPPRVWTDELEGPSLWTSNQSRTHGIYLRAATQVAGGVPGATWPVHIPMTTFHTGLLQKQGITPDLVHGIDSASHPHLQSHGIHQDLGTVGKLSSQRTVMRSAANTQRSRSSSWKTDEAKDSTAPPTDHHLAGHIWPGPLLPKTRSRTSGKTRKGKKGERVLKQTLQDPLLWLPSPVTLLRAPERRFNYVSPEIKQETPDVRGFFNHREQTSETEQSSTDSAQTMPYSQALLRRSRPVPHLRTRSRPHCRAGVYQRLMNPQPHRT